MSDLNDFFAKKDRKKKKIATRSTVVQLPKEGAVPTENEAEASVGAPPLTAQKQADDGWIEFEDPKGAQVNTGGRTVVEFKREEEDNEHNGDGNMPAEKFNGWNKAGDDEEEVGEEAEAEEPTAAKAPSSAFPSLADTADAPEVPITRGNSSSGPSSASGRARPRFINSSTSKLREKLANRTAGK